MLSVKSTE